MYMAGGIIMHSKKIISVLLAVGLISAASFFIYKTDAKESLGESVEQNTVYSKGDTSEKQDDSENEYDIVGEEKDAYEEKSADILKGYFNIGDEDFENLTFRASRINEKTINKMESNLKEHVEDAYNEGKISKDEYDQEMKYCDGGKDDSYAQSRKIVEGLKHGMISVVWIGHDRTFQCVFNENTKELDEGLVETFHDKSEPILSLDKEELNNMAGEYIKENKLSNIENPQFMFTQETRGDTPDQKSSVGIINLYYEDKDDESKKAIVGIDEYTGKITSFETNGYAQYKYENIENKN